MPISQAAASIELTIVYERVDNGWLQARIAELSAVITAAESRREARDMVLDAVREYLRSARDTPPGIEGERETVELTITGRGDVDES